MGLSKLIVSVHFMKKQAKFLSGIWCNWMWFYALLNSVDFF